MSDIKLFRLAAGAATEIQGLASELEKPLQTLIEHNLEPLLGIRFLATEHVTGKTHGGRIDTLGIDENDCPVIIEYKRSIGENVINQGLYYLDWLMDHQAEFKLLTLERYGREAADSIDWASPRLICIAADFTKYDAHAVQQIDWNIELIRYRKFEPDLLLFELVNSVASEPTTRAVKPPRKGTTAVEDPKPRPRWLPELNPELRALFESLKTFIESLGDDVQQKNLKLYIAFKRLRNFATVAGYKKSIVLYLHLDPSTVKTIDGFTRNVRGLGHWGTGDLEVVLKSQDDLDRAKPLITKAYQAS